jgi:hypothetical protein
MTGTKGRSGRRNAVSLSLSPPPPPPDDADRLNSPRLYQIHELRWLLLKNRGQIPEDDYAKLDAYFREQGRQAPWGKRLIHMTRWYHVKSALSDGYKIIDGSAFEYAAAECADTPAVGGPAAMKASYFWMKKHMREKDLGW